MKGDSSLNCMDELNTLAARHPYRYSYENGRYYRQRYYGGELKVLGCLEVFSVPCGVWLPATGPTIRSAA